MSPLTHYYRADIFRNERIGTKNLWLAGNKMYSYIIGTDKLGVQWFLDFVSRPN